MDMSLLWIVIMLNNCILSQKGSYIIYIVSGNAEKIEKTVI